MQDAETKEAGKAPFLTAGGLKIKELKKIRIKPAVYSHSENLCYILCCKQVSHTDRVRNDIAKISDNFFVNQAEKGGPL